jgi:hypothetical protein
MGVAQTPTFQLHFGPFIGAFEVWRTGQALADHVA